MRTRRGKRNRATLHDQPVLYSTLQAGEQDTHNNTPPPGEHQQDYYNTGAQYDEVVIKLKPQPSIPSGYEVIDDYEDTMTVEDNKHDSERKATDNASSVHVYTLPNKQKGKKTDDKERKEQDSQDSGLLSNYTKVDKRTKTERKEETNKGKVELLYAKVNALTKKEKTETQQGNVGIIGQQRNISPPDLRLGYEPSADSDSSVPLSSYCGRTLR